MPDEKFYIGLSLADQLERFIDHHSDQKNRHISIYEVKLLEAVRLRLMGYNANPKTEEAEK